MAFIEMDFASGGSSSNKGFFQSGTTSNSVTCDVGFEPTQVFIYIDGTTYAEWSYWNGDSDKRHLYREGSATVGSTTSGTWRSDKDNNTYSISVSGSNVNLACYGSTLVGKPYILMAVKA